MLRRRLLTSIAALAVSAVALTGCAGATGDDKTLNIDFATYNPLSLIIKDQGWLEEALADRGVEVNWLQSHGSNKANSALRSEAIDVGSTAGSAALLARANGSKIQVIDLYSQPEWAAIVVAPGSEITSMQQLRGKKIAATKGTDPYFFLLQSLKANGLTTDDVEVVNLQHADGWAALQNGSVDAWSGLDPIMANAETVGAKLIYRNLEFNTWGFLNATESFLEQQPEVAQIVVDTYEYARAWAQQNPDETAKVLSEVGGISLEVAEKVLAERTNLDTDPVPGAKQLAVLREVGPVFVKSGDVASQDSIDQALEEIVNDTFIKNADPSRINP